MQLIRPSRRIRRPHGWTRPGFAAWHRSACDCCGCRSSVTLTVSGVDGNPCNCFVSGANYYNFYNLAGVNGSYNVPLFSTFTIGGNLVCNYRLDPITQNLGATIDRDTFALADTTCTTPTATANCIETYIVVQVWDATQRLRIVEYFIFTSGGGAPGVEVMRHASTAYPGGTAIGASFANALTCGAVAGSTAGSGVVS